MFNFSSNNLFWIRTIITSKCNICIFVDRHTNRTYALYDFSKEHAFIPDKAYCVSGKVNAADKLYLVMESMKEDRKDHSKTK